MKRLSERSGANSEQSRSCEARTSAPRRRVRVLESHRHSLRGPVDMCNGVAGRVASPARHCCFENFLRFVAPFSHGEPTGTQVYREMALPEYESSLSKRKFHA